MYLMTFIFPEPLFPVGIIIERSRTGGPPCGVEAILSSANPGLSRIPGEWRSTPT
jgi:hypothetical protein